MNELHQKAVFRKNHYLITEEGISVKEKSFSTSDEYSVKFEDIGTRIVKQKKGRRGWLVAAIIFLLLAIGMFVMAKTGASVEADGYIVYLLLSAISITVYYFTVKRGFYLTNNDNTKAIEFLVDKPSAQTVDAFITSLKEKRKEHLIAKYAQLSKLISYEQQYNMLAWLNNNEVLTEQEYNKKMEELTTLFSVPNPVIGFRNRNSAY